MTNSTFLPLYVMPLYPDVVSTVYDDKAVTIMLRYTDVTTKTCPETVSPTDRFQKIEFIPISA